MPGLGISWLDGIQNGKAHHRLQRRLKQRGLKLEVSEPANKLLANLGYDPAYGARPLKRTIQREVMDSLALKILEGEFQEGNTISVDIIDSTFLFTKQ